MRWRRRDEPWGSHHVEARASKWDISDGLTEVELKRILGWLQNRREKLRRALGRRAMICLNGGTWTETAKGFLELYADMMAVDASHLRFNSNFL